MIAVAPRCPRPRLGRPRVVRAAAFVSGPVGSTPPSPAPPSASPPPLAGLGRIGVAGSPRSFTRARRIVLDVHDVVVALIVLAPRNRVGRPLDAGATVDVLLGPIFRASSITARAGPAAATATPAASTPPPLAAVGVTAFALVAVGLTEAGYSRLGQRAVIAGIYNPVPRGSRTLPGGPTRRSVVRERFARPGLRGPGFRGPGFRSPGLGRRRSRFALRRRS